MRLFAAIPLPPVAHEAAARSLHEIRDLGWPVRWVRQEGLHLTLKFFGEVVPERLETIAEMLGFSVDRVPQMVLAITGAGVFPHASRPRVIRLDLSGCSELELLQDRIERGGERIGFPPEGRPFHPHLTLGRVREGHRLPSGALDFLSKVPPQPSFIADRLVLFESELGVDGPLYQARAEFILR